MAGFLNSNIGSNLIPAILAGVIGGFGAYIAVRIDVAVLMSNQTTLIEQGKAGGIVLAEHETEIRLLKYQVDNLKDGIVSR